MVRYTCPACGAGVDLPMPALPGQSVACPNCRHDMVQAPQAGAPPVRVAARPRMTWSLKRQAQVLFGIVALFWVLEIVDCFLPATDSLTWWGIWPHSAHSLLHIFFAPFLHVGFAHLIANTVVFVPLAWLVMLRGPRDFLLVSLISMVVSGLGIWLLASPGRIHLGASGVIFGYLGFLLLRGYFDRSPQSFLIAVGVGVLFGYLLWGILPTDRGISWQGHLFGFVGGALAAWLLAFRHPEPVARGSANRG